MCFATAAVFVGSSFDSCISLVFTLHYSTAAVCGLDFNGGACFENWWGACISILSMLGYFEVKKYLQHDMRSVYCSMRTDKHDAVCAVCAALCLLIAHMIWISNLRSRLTVWIDSIMHASSWNLSTGV